MKNLMHIFVSMLLLSLSVLTLAHEGHDNTPGSLKSLHGGTVLAGKQLNLEYIVNGEEITLYPISHQGKDILVKEIKIEATAKPKKGKSYRLEFQNIKSNFIGLIATAKLNGANRLPIELSISYQNLTDHFTVQIEE